MIKLDHTLTYEIKPVSPYNFNLTVSKPAGWPLCTPLEIYDKGTLWTAVYLNDTLVGLRLTSKGTISNPCIEADISQKQNLQRETRSNKEVIGSQHWRIRRPA
jgi:hypothetical protein